MNEDILLTKEDKKKALSFFKNMQFDTPVPLTKINNLNKFYKSIELVNYSIFINDYEIYIDNDCFIKVKPIIWESEFLLFLASLKPNEKVRINLFNDFQKVKDIIVKIKDKYFPDFLFVIENGFIDNFQTDFFYKSIPESFLKVDERDLYEFENDFEG